ncbi:cytochrome b5-related protein-like isoform X1 [Adelges cooleyi]|uniref:cytochrome b5-related protein-like isoform X1 n=1 Tax=Adelges cooleyi TaxID=133065 RepID=UPI0021804DC3|nr:cytochrome b5-related protein-like isoform X1 [Adelges cooleyi]
MAPRTSSWPTLNNLPSTDRNIKRVDGWINARRKEDGAEGLWRVHDGLYDLQEWIPKHPGGSQWLEITKGVDITELFETYHLKGDVATQKLRTFYVRNASTPRSSPFTFKPDGFYKVLKSRVSKKISTINHSNILLKSKLVVDTFILLALLLCAESARRNSYYVAVLAGVSLAFGLVANHNFTHLKDNWRMYYIQLGLFSVREWRISHTVSHHCYANTVCDLEMTLPYPFIHWYPSKDKPWSVLWFSKLTPLTYPFSTIYLILGRTITLNNEKADCLSFIIPIVLMSAGNLSLGSVLTIWLLVITTMSSVFVFLGFNGAHHHPDNFHDGDEISQQDIDFGLHQLNACSERQIIGNSVVISMITFGDHSLHHLFPGLDHSLLPHIYDVFEETCKEFGLELKLRTYGEYVRGQFQQLVRTNPRKA